MIFGFIVLLRSLERVADLTKSLFLNDEPCMVIPTLINMNPNELRYYPFMISLSKQYIYLFFTEVETSYSQNICSKRNKNIYLKAVNMITNKHKAKAVKEHVSCDCK